MARSSMNVIESFSVFDKILYGFLCAIFYPIKYMTLIPFFIINGSFRRYPIPKVSSVCVKKSEDEITLRDISSKSKLKGALEGHHSIADILRICAEKNPDKKCVGSRVVIKKEDYADPISGRALKRVHLGSYQWKTHQETLQIVNQYAYGLLAIGLLENNNNRAAIFADNCEEWFYSSQAIISTGCQLVTVYTTLPDDSILYAVNITQVSHIIVDAKSLNRFLEIFDRFDHVKYVILMSSCEHSQYENHHANQVLKFYTIKQLCSKGADLLASEECLELKPTKDNSVALIMFTSGSTGVPKGVEISHKNVLTQIGSEVDNYNQWGNKLFAAFLPSSHILEFVAELSILSYGGTLGFCTPLTLTDKSPMIIPGTKGDLPILKPQVALFVPLLLDRLSKAVLMHFREQSYMKRIFIQFLIDYKKHFISKGHKTPLIDMAVFSKVAAIIGYSTDIVLSAGAPLCDELCLFSSVIFCINLKQGYGATETVCGGSLGRSKDPFSCDVGHITPSCELKLIPWEEGGYFPSDKPYPRGEIIIGGDNVCLGYYQNKQLNDESFVVDSNGMRWFKTGDIGLIYSNGHLQIVDRKKDIIKLKHGEYVCITRIESVLIKSKFVDMICVSPNSDSTYLVAIVVPNRQQIINLVKSLKKKVIEDIITYIDDVLIVDIITEDIRKCSLTLHKFDRPEKYFYVKETWNPENNFTTPSMKLKRVEIHKYYKHLLE